MLPLRLLCHGGALLASARTCRLKAAAFNAAPAYQRVAVIYRKLSCTVVVRVGPAKQLASCEGLDMMGLTHHWPYETSAAYIQRGLTVSAGLYSTNLPPTHHHLLSGTDEGTTQSGDSETSGRSHNCLHLAQQLWQDCCTACDLSSGVNGKAVCSTYARGTAAGSQCQR